MAVGQTLRKPTAVEGAAVGYPAPVVVRLCVAVPAAPAGSGVSRLYRDRPAVADASFFRQPSDSGDRPAFHRCFGPFHHRALDSRRGGRLYLLGAVGDPLADTGGWFRVYDLLFLRHVRADASLGEIQEPLVQFPVFLPRGAEIRGIGAEHHPLRFWV